MRVRRKAKLSNRSAIAAAGGLSRSLTSLRSLFGAQALAGAWSEWKYVIAAGLFGLQRLTSASSLLLRGV